MMVVTIAPAQQCGCVGWCERTDRSVMRCRVLPQACDALLSASALPAAARHAPRLCAPSAARSGWTHAFVSHTTHQRGATAVPLAQTPAA